MHRFMYYNLTYVASASRVDNLLIIISRCFVSTVDYLTYKAPLVNNSEIAEKLSKIGLNLLFLQSAFVDNSRRG